MKKILFLFVITAFGLYSCGDDCCKKPAATSEQQAAPNTNDATAMYQCPMKCEPATADKTAKCGKCGMSLKEVK
jgi:hypothetical protein